MDDGTKQSTIATAHSKGAVVTVSLGGSTDSPWNKDPTALGKQVEKEGRGERERRNIAFGERQKRVL